MSKRILNQEVKSHLGQEVVVAGWVHNIRALGGIEFIILRDRSGILQTVLDRTKVKVERLTNESVVEIKGKVKADQRAPGGVEIEISQLKIISRAEENLPIEVNKKRNLLKAGLDVILTHRPISLRNPDLRAIFKVEAEIVWAFREFLKKNDFTEIKSSKIVSTGTEGGANLFRVDYFGREAYLAQSPQFYKQIMVSSGFERVFEVGMVYRAEDHNTSRHLNEYLSLDYEMSFIENEQDVIRLEIELLKAIFSHLKKTCAAELALYQAEIPEFETIPQITLQEAKELLKKEYQKDLRGAKDLDPEGEKLLCQYYQEKENIPLVYVTEYPVEKRPVYTMPHESKPGVTRSFDLLFKGREITTGGQRIHSYQMLLENMRKFRLNPARFSSYLSIFKYGMPPHGGLAIGAERFTQQLLNLENIREASLFPRDRNRLTP
jgi:nondiscriminating aspartyl-tRNA synthetase